MKRLYTRQLGSGMLGLLIVTLAFSVGGYVGDIVFNSLGAQALQDKSKFIVGAYALLLSSLWVLYNDLKKLKDREDLSPREEREVTYHTDRGIKKVLKIAALYIFSALFALTSAFWPIDSTHFVWGARIAGGLFFVSTILIFVIVRNMYELHQFEDILAARKKQTVRANKLLKDFKKT